MNNKVAIGLVVAILVIVVLFFTFHQVQAPAAFAPSVGTTTSQSAATTVTVTAPSAPTASQSSKVPAPAAVVNTAPVKAGHLAAFDVNTLTSTSGHPFITGTANVKTVGIVVDDPQGVGIAGSFEIPVENGHWSFAVPQEIKSGTYTLHLIGGDSIVVAKLVVNVP